ncbi:DinB family protein [Cohnella lubricantis]|uniref:DinB family protein n=1 Tax=Cohnella lubricantis TaxID=2163172 RepID=A0A841TA50_9BACL|nr:DinB family protein [Cohnella lubricantis]MBB6676919.1 DinB family protein [Cohnella lubricantis]
MQTLFRYNWLIRERWYEWCKEVPHEELIRERTGGVGSILKTLYHIVDVEWSWMQDMQGKSFPHRSFDNFNTLAAIRQLDQELHEDVETFVNAWDDSMNRRALRDTELDGSISVYAWGEVMRHVIAHEIHHIGQLSIWSRELGRPPVSANLIRNALILPEEAK